MATTMPSWLLCDVATAVAYLRITESVDDTFARMVRRATGRVETYCQRKLKSRSYTAGTRLVVSGRDSERLSLPEYPVTAVSSAAYRTVENGSEVETSISLTGLRILPGGILVLGSGVWPIGDGNILVAAECGYKAGTHDSELDVLEQATLRLLQVWWQDYVNQTGRATSMNGRGGGASFVEGDMPDDVADMLSPFVRMV